MEERKIIGFSDIYTVTKCGIVYSYAYGKKKKKSYFKTKKGYLVVTLSAPHKGKNRHQIMRVHRLVALAWIPNPENKPFVCHKNDVKQDNHINNLYWGDRATNGQDAVLNGATSRGERKNKNVLKEADVHWIRSNYIPYDKVYGQASMSRKFGVHESTIKKIINRVNWRYLPTPPKGQKQ